MEIQKPSIFARRRGRPKKESIRKDTGTPELVMKRLQKKTTEALDLCLDRGIITPEHHWCGIHLRWLYTLRYGAPGVRAVDTAHLGGIVIRLEDSEWLNAREQEYNDAIHKLRQKGLASLLINLCIYNERPYFLDHPPTLRNIDMVTHFIENLQAGLELLSSHWIPSA
jgi:hypothetical protein